MTELTHLPPFAGVTVSGRAIHDLPQRPPSPDLLRVPPATGPSQCRMPEYAAPVTGPETVAVCPSSLLLRSWALRRNGETRWVGLGVLGGLCGNKGGAGADRKALSIRGRNKKVHPPFPGTLGRSGGSTRHAGKPYAIRLMTVILLLIPSIRHVCSGLRRAPIE